MSSTNRLKILLVRLGWAMSSINSPMRFRSNTKLHTFNMVPKEWIINLTTFSMGSTFILAHPLSMVAMARFNSEIFRALFKYPCNNKENLYNNKGNICYRKGNICCSKGYLHNSKGKWSRKKVNCKKCKGNPQNNCSKPWGSKCTMLCKPPSPCPRRANFCNPRDKFFSSKANPCSSKTNPSNNNPCIHIRRVNPCKGKARAKFCSSRPEILVS